MESIDSYTEASCCCFELIKNFRANDDESFCSIGQFKVLPSRCTLTQHFSVNICSPAWKIILNVNISMIFIPFLDSPGFFGINKFLHSTAKRRNANERRKSTEKVLGMVSTFSTILASLVAVLCNDLSSSRPSIYLSDETRPLAHTK